jgi:hypothetical protein
MVPRAKSWTKTAPHALLFGNQDTTVLPTSTWSLDFCNSPSSPPESSKLIQHLRKGGGYPLFASALFKLFLHLLLWSGEQGMGWFEFLDLMSLYSIPHCTGVTLRAVLFALARWVPDIFLIATTNDLQTSAWGQDSRHLTASTGQGDSERRAGNFLQALVPTICTDRDSMACPRTRKFYL